MNHTIQRIHETEGWKMAYNTKKRSVFNYGVDFQENALKIHPGVPESL